MLIMGLLRGSSESKWLRAEQEVRPPGCFGRLGVRVETRGSGQAGEVHGVGKTKYDITTYLGCAGLEDSPIDVHRDRYVRQASDRPNHELDRLKVDSLQQSAAHIVAKCATCPLGQEGALRVQAQDMIALRTAEIEGPTVQGLPPGAAGEA